MAVNSYLILEQLEQCIDKKLEKCTTECKIKYATIYNPVINMKSNTTYLVVNKDCFPEENPDDEKCLLILLGECDADIMKSTKHDVICMEESVGLGNLYEQVQEIIEYYNRWEDELGNILLKGGSLNEICSVSVPYFQNPMTIQNESFKIIGVGENDTISYPYDFLDETGQYLSEKWVNSALKNESKVFSKKGPFEFHYVNQHSSLLYNIFEAGNYVAQICVDANHRKLVVEDFVRICILAKYVKEFIRHDYSKKYTPRDRFSALLKDYVEGKDNTEQLMVHLLKRNWKPEDNYVCCIISGKELKNKEVSPDYFCEKWEKLLGDCVAFSMEQCICLLIHLGKGDIIPETMVTEMEDAGKEHRSKVFFSAVFENGFESRNYFKQAQHIMELEADSEQRVFQFEQLKLHYVISYGMKSLPIEVLLPKGLKKLISYDKENNTDYCDTLRCYLESGCNITETVNQLYMHRSTVKYRLQRIKEIMESELTDYSELMYLSMLLYEYHEVAI